MADFAEREWRSKDGLSLYARDYAGADGEARLPVVCLHGLTRNSKDFEELAPRVAATGRRVLVPDVRGRGRSDRDSNPDNYKPLVYARDVLALMDRLGIARAVFVGTSMGGIVTMTIAALRRRAIVAVVLNDVGPEVGRAGVDRILGYAGRLAAVSSWDDAAEHVRGINAVAFPNNKDADWAAFARRTFRDEAGRPMLDYDPQIMAPLSERRPKTRSLLASLLFRRMARTRPTLLVRGALSDLMTDEIAGRMQRAAPALKVAVVQDVGHAPLLSEPEAAKAIDDFLAAVP